MPRTVYGNNHSLNGWPMVTAEECEWVTVPGTNGNVHLQIQKGAPAAILGAFAADWNAYIEPVHDSDSACWTPTNSVPTSDHLSGTAIDIRWNSHPFKVSYAGFDQRMIDTMTEMLEFYEGICFWGQNWVSPKDAMHVSLNGDAYGGPSTFNNPHTADFITRKIRPDGFSTFRRGGGTATPPTVSRRDWYASEIIAVGTRRGVTARGIQIALATALVESNLHMYANSNVPESLNIKHDKIGNDHDSVGLFQQRCPMWGPVEVLMNPARSAGLFFDRLTKLDYNNPARPPGYYAAEVQQPDVEYRGRYQERMGEAVNLYNRLSTVAPEGDDMALVPQDQWDRVYRELTQRLPSRSPLRRLGEGPIDTVSGFLLNVDGSEHVEICRLLAGYGHPPTLALLREVAGADPNVFPDRRDDALLAQAILADVGSPTPAVSDRPSVSVAAPQVVYVDRPVPAAPVGGGPPDVSTAELIGNLYAALEAFKTAHIDLGPQALESIDALIVDLKSGE